MRCFCWFILLFVASYGCSPVRSTQKSHIPKDENEQQKVVQNKPDTNNERFSDTTLITLQDVSAERQGDINTIFKKAVEQFRNEQYNRACPKFKLFTETLAGGDSLLYEAMFFDCECMIMEDKIVEAKIILEDILADEEATAKIREKSLVRIGQIECVLGNEQKAQMYFTQFREQFPDSKYKKLADCNAIE